MNTEQLIAELLKITESHFTVEQVKQICRGRLNKLLEHNVAVWEEEFAINRDEREDWREVLPPRIKHIEPII